MVGEFYIRFREKAKIAGPRIVTSLAASPGDTLVFRVGLALLKAALARSADARGGLGRGRY